MLQVTVNIQMEGTADEVQEWLFRLGGRIGEAGTVEAEPTKVEAVYTPQIADRLIRRVTNDARRALRFIAENAPEVPWEEVQEHLGISGIQIGGVMASFGFAENAGIPRPYRNDPGRRVYVIEPSVASVMLEAIERFENQHGQAA